MLPARLYYQHDGQTALVVLFSSAGRFVEDKKVDSYDTWVAPEILRHMVGRSMRVGFYMSGQEGSGLNYGEYTVSVVTLICKSLCWVAVTM